MSDAWNEYDTLQLVAVRDAKQAFSSEACLDDEWQKLRFHERPDLSRAIEEHRAFRSCLKRLGAELIMLESLPETRSRLERAGCRVQTYCGIEISRKGEGGRRV